jgi:hypothetical protein
VNIRVFNQKVLEPGSQWLMILGIVFLCQPWIEVLHQWSVTVMLIGIIAFNFAVHIPPPEKKAEDADAAGSVGAGHG